MVDVRRGRPSPVEFGGSTGHHGHEELALRFLPRLDPLIRALKLTCRGASDEVAVEFGLVPAAAR